MKTFDATVSVIVPTYNRARYIRECVDSLLAQTVAPSEVIVVDDGSEDETRQLLAAYGDKLRVIRKENGGKSTAVNAGAQVATGKWIWIFDDDDVAYPDAIEARLAVLQKEAAAGFCYGEHTLGHDRSDGLIQMTKAARVTPAPTEALFLETARSCFFHFGTCLVDREVFLTLGGFDTSLIRGQDYDFQIRLTHATKGVFCPTPIFIFRQHDGIRGTLKLQHDAKSRAIVFRQYSQLLGRKLRSSYPLADYIVPRSKADLHDAHRRTALLHRAQVMANHGCFDEMICDLAAFAHIAIGNGHLHAAEKQLIGSLAQMQWAHEVMLDDWPKAQEKLRSLSSTKASREVRRAFALGLIWRAKSFADPPLQRVKNIWRGGRLMLG